MIASRSFGSSPQLVHQIGYVLSLLVACTGLNITYSAFTALIPDFVPCTQHKPFFFVYLLVYFVCYNIVYLNHSGLTSSLSNKKSTAKIRQFKKKKNSNDVFMSLSSLSPPFFYFLTKHPKPAWPLEFSD